MIVRTLLLLVALVALVGCGVPTEGSAELTDEDQVPFGLLDEDREPVAGASRQGRTALQVYLYRENDDELLPVVRLVEGSSPAAALGELERAPSDAESSVGLRSALADTDAVGDVEVDGGVAIVDLREEFADLSGSDQLVAIAQVVFTATARPDADQVSFTLDGASVEVPRGDGSLTAGVVTRADYATFVTPS